ncbi:Uma2 family endonuclease [Paludisphaera sp.]|uniref:Uma2 family endonuclease n=1 Tax=Paludisphaera sp. TaxID=2017432 RepID=UPI00301E00DE
MATVTTGRPRTAPDRDAAVSLAIPPDVRLITDADGFEKLCAANRDMQLELEADGGLIVMAPASPDGSGRELQLAFQLEAWNRISKSGKVFGATAGFTLPDGSIRAPDASWMRQEAWDALDRRERRKFSRAVPDFAAEIRSPSDSLDDLRAKMAGYIANGVRLAWLIDPETKAVEVYRPGRDPERLTAPKTLSGEDVLPGFTLDLADIFEG